MDGAVVGQVRDVLGDEGGEWTGEWASAGVWRAVRWWKERGKLCSCAAGSIEEESWMGMRRGKLGERDCLLGNWCWTGRFQE